MNRNLIINIYNMSNIVEPGRKKNFCFSFLTFFRRRVVYVFFLLEQLVIITISANMGSSANCV